MNKIFNTGVVIVAVTMLSLQGEAKKIAHKPTIEGAVGIQKDIVIPLNTLYKKNKDPLTKELAQVSENLYKFAHKKVAVKYEAYQKTSASLQEGMLNSESPYAYIKVLKALIEKRLEKEHAYEGRLATMTDTLTAVSKKVAASQETLRKELMPFVDELKKKIGLTADWLKASKDLFEKELKMVNEMDLKLHKK